MADILLKDQNGEEIRYDGYTKVAFNAPDGEVAVFSEGVAEDEVPIQLDFSSGDQYVIAGDKKLIKSAVIQKPDNLIPENIVSGVTIAGVIGQHSVHGVSIDVFPDFSDGDYTVSADEGSLIQSATIKKPTNLAPENIAKDIEIAGVVGTLASGGSGGSGGGGGAVTEKDVNFYDFDGTLVASYTVDEIQALTEMPTGPVHDGLMFQGWNWTLEDLKAENAPMNVGAMYCAIDDAIYGNATSIHIMLPLEGNSFTFYIRSTGINTFFVDWGDCTTSTHSKTSTDEGLVSFSHSYTSSGGEYTITLFRTDGVAEYWIGYNSPTSSGNNVTFSPPSAVTSVIFSNDVTYIPPLLFYQCYSLQSVTIPNSVTSIGASAFYYCYLLQFVTIPNNVTSISNSLFNGCYSLQSVTIPNSVTSIGSSAFRYCYSLQSLTIPNSVTSIGASAFYYCHVLRIGIIPNNVTYIGQYAFNGCYSLQSVTIPNGVTSLSDYCFRACTSLQFLTIPNSVSRIGSSATYNCDALHDVYVYATTPPALSSDNFSNSNTAKRIHVPSGCEDAYKAATRWSSLKDYIVGDL